MTADAAQFFPLVPQGTTATGACGRQHRTMTVGNLPPAASPTNGYPQPTDVRHGRRRMPRMRLN